MINKVTAGSHLVIETEHRASSFSVHHTMMPIQETTGNTRFNPTTGNIEYYNGLKWMTMPYTNVSIKLENETEQVLAWAKQKMIEDELLQSRLKDCPSLKHAYEQFKLLDALTIKESLDDGT